MDDDRSRSRAGKNIVCQTVALIATLQAVLLSENAIRISRIETKALAGSDVVERLRIGRKRIGTAVGSRTFRTGSATGNRGVTRAGNRIKWRVRNVVIGRLIVQVTTAKARVNYEIGSREPGSLTRDLVRRSKPARRWVTNIIEGRGAGRLQ